MKRLSVVAVILLAAALTLTAAAGCGSSGTSSNGKTFTINDTNITAKVGDQFTIELDSNQTTGFQWGISGSLNPKIVKKISSTYIAGANPSGAAGVGGKEKWKFQVMGAGTGTIVMIYSQRFDKTAPPAKTVTFTVTAT